MLKLFGVYVVQHPSIYSTTEQFSSLAQSLKQSFSEVNSHVELCINKSTVVVDDVVDGMFGCGVSTAVSTAKHTITQHEKVRKMDDLDIPILKVFQQ